MHGMMRTDFTMIRAGSVLRANGGFLVVNALDALLEPSVWTSLKRILRYNSIEIQSLEPLTLVSTAAIKPAPVASRVKVVMIGDDDLYYNLYYMDDDFRKIFKIKADFDSEMDRSSASVHHRCPRT